LKAKNKDKIHVVAEVTTGELPNAWPWGILCGIAEVAHLFQGTPVNVYAMREGTAFFPRDNRGFREPVLFIEGPYCAFCALETPMLGLICQSTGVGVEPSGTMPHALMIAMGDQVEAWKAFDEVISPDVPRVCLVDTYLDEKVEAIMAAEALGKRLSAVRLDTPRSRKGDLAEIVREVRWELDIRGYSHVKIFVSGGLDEDTVKTLGEAGAEAFGVGTSISNAPTVDFALDIVEVEGKFAAKRGKLSGKKQVWRCEKCLMDIVLPFSEPMPRCPICGGETAGMLQPLVMNGEIVIDLLKPKDIREYVLSQLESLEASFNKDRFS
jgi:nicotinate phosphoribosyltransferase